jgi:hypothetical protein
MLEKWGSCLQRFTWLLFSVAPMASLSGINVYLDKLAIPVEFATMLDG